MFKRYQLFFYILIILIIGFLVWFYADIVAYILIAAVMSIVGQPIVGLLKKVHIPRTIGALLTLVFLLAIFLSFFLIFVPLFAREAEMLSHMDFKALGENFSEPLQNLKGLLVKYNVIEQGDTLEPYLQSRMKDLVGTAAFSGLVKHVLHTTEAFLIGTFAVCFITFFFLKDEFMFQRIVMSFVNEAYHSRTKAVLIKIRHLLRRYFIGLISDIILMMTLISLAMWLFGIHSALLIGFFAGIVVIIPYIGPLLGVTLAVIIGVTGALAVDVHTAILPLALKIVAIYMVINMNDGLVFQPLIYGKSVKASPLEIFLILLISGTTAGIAGMAIAVPVYTVLRIIAKEFFSQFRPVKQLTSEL
jgi:predicted PurR-regulated permease PerM